MMDSLLFALFMMSFAAPAIVAGAIGITARTKRAGLLALLITEVITIFGVIALQTSVYSLYSGWDGGRAIILFYALLSYILNVISLRFAMIHISNL
jgi:hypothetical protein